MCYALRCMLGSLGKLPYITRKYISQDGRSGARQRGSELGHLSPFGLGAARRCTAGLGLCMLVQPWADHREAVAALLAGEQLRDLQAMRLLQLAKNDAVKRCKGRWSASAPRGAAFTYHCWLYHMLGGAASKLLPPSLTDTSTAFKLYRTAAEADLRQRREARARAASCSACCRR